MGRGRIGAAEFERLVARTGNAKYLARPYSGRKDGMPVSECVRMASEKDRSIAMASGTMSGDNPLIVRMAVCRAANRMAVRGRRADSFALMLTVPETMTEEQLRPYMRVAYEHAELSDVEIVRTDTRLVTAHVVATGEAEETELRYPDGEYSIVMCGLTGAEETVLRYEEHRKMLRLKYPKHFLEDIPELANGADMRTVCRQAWQNGAVYGYACDDGGVYAGLFGMSERLRTGLRVSLPDIPISQKTIEVCEELDIDPYQIGAGGCIFLITPEPERLLTALYALDTEAVKIGALQTNPAKELCNGGEVRCLEPYRGSAFLR